MICFQCPQEFDLSLSQFVLHRIAHTSMELFSKLIGLGFIDSHVEGGEAFIRFDFWNSNHKKGFNRGIL